MDRPVEQLVDEILVMDCQSGSVKALEILLSVPEISAALKIPKGTVKSRLANARKELKELWQQARQTSG